MVAEIVQLLMNCPLTLCGFDLAKASITARAFSSICFGAKDALPTLKDVVAFLLTAHLGVHLGQLSSWRRMIGLPPLF